MHSRSLRLLLVVAVAALLVEPALGQFRFRGGPRFFQRFDLETATDAETAEAPEAPSAAPPSAEDLLRRLDEIEDRNAAPVSRERGLAMILEQPHLASTNFYDPNGIRYLSVRLVLLNLTDQALSLAPESFAFEEDGTRHTLAEAGARLSRSFVQFEGQARQYQPPTETLEIPAQGTASQWLAFPIDSVAAVPAMSLLIDWEKGAERLDINAYERGVLGLRTERLGPRDCAALLTIGGELNTVNAATLADDIGNLSTTGVVRAVIAWGDAAAPVNEQVYGWLVMGSSEDAGHQYGHMPQIPASVAELHLVKPAGHVSNPWEHYQQYVPLHDSADTAMVAALRTAFESVTRDDLRKELRHGHRLSRAAALAHSGARLGKRELPLVLAACDSGDAFLQAQALAALGQYNEPEAIGRLVAAAGSPETAVMQAAVGSLAGSRFPQAHAALRDFLTRLDGAQTVGVIEVLARFPRREWIDLIASYHESSDPLLRRAALQALVRLGHPAIVDLLGSALTSDDPELVALAYAQLAARSDSRSEMLATNHALSLLETAPPDPTTQSVLARAHDRRALPALKRHIDAVSGPEREPMIQLLLQIGGTEVIPDVLTLYPQLTPTAKAVVLEALLAARAPEAQPLAFEAIKSGQAELWDVATRIVTTKPDPATVSVLIEALEQASSYEAWNPLCSALARIGDPASRAALLAARQSDDEQKRGAAMAALIQIKQSSPAHQYAFQAAQLLEQAAELTEEEVQTSRRQSQKLLDLAISFDAEYAEAFAQRGHLLLLQQQLPAAQADFDQAVRLDPFDPLGITGQAIVAVLLGDPERGVQQIREAADKFPGDIGFEYNSACVYGRAVEVLGKGDRPDAAQLQQEYRAAALTHLRNSMLLGFPSKEFIEKDPDLAILHDDPTYQELLRNPPEPGDEDIPLDALGEFGIQ